MSENFDALLLHLEQVSATRTPVPPVNGAFVDPRQIARVLRCVEEEDWEYLGMEDNKNGTRYIGGHGDVHLIGCGDDLRPLYQDARGRWYLAYYKEPWRYGEPDADATKRLLKLAREYAL